MAAGEPFPAAVQPSHAIGFPLINQSTPSCTLGGMSTESAPRSKGIGAMRAIMQGLTDAEFERLYGTEGQCLVAWVKARQDAGMPCPRCDNPKCSVCDRRVGRA